MSRTMGHNCRCGAKGIDAELFERGKLSDEVAAARVSIGFVEGIPDADVLAQGFDEFRDVIDKRRNRSLIRPAAGAIDPGWI